MTIQYGFEVWEHYDDPASPEPFGIEVLDRLPTVGEEIDLHWLNGNLYRRVKIVKVDLDKHRIDVEHLK